MNELFINDHIQDLKNAIMSQISHRTLQETNVPDIGDEKLFYLLLPFLNGEDWTKSHHDAAVSVGIVYSALYAHESIEEFNVRTTNEQLTVLAGDYYSGVHYKILSNIPDIGLIRSLSTTIAKISESKAYFYENAIRYLKDCLQAVEIEESSSIETFYKHFGYEQYIPIVQMALMLARLKEELLNFMESRKTKFLEALLQSEEVNFVRHRLFQLLNDRINEISAALDRQVEQSAFLSKELKSLLLKRMAPMLT
ncbi:heptaprenyl diphosphate synthase component 1 [Chungangia koreensis]|uniref:Heptaprenyl diphosphate synthase component 1 n=1 Tax=Chungangia koreensis TaxID=752657 RepID=A0ABV8X5A9_9LACT